MAQNWMRLSSNKIVPLCTLLVVSLDMAHLQFKMIHFDYFLDYFFIMTAISEAKHQSYFDLSSFKWLDESHE